MCNFQSSYKHCTSNCEFHLTTVCCIDNGLFLEILFTPQIQKFWLVIGFYFQSDNDLLFYWLPSDMTSSHIIDFDGLYNIGDTDEHKVDRPMWGFCMSKIWLYWGAVLHITTAWFVQGNKHWHFLPSVANTRSAAKRLTFSV